MVSLLKGFQSLATNYQFHFISFIRIFAMKLDEKLMQDKDACPE